MKKQSVLALLLGLTLLCTAIIPSVFAADGDSSGNGMVINKTATANNDGSYTIQLEAYATGSKIISEVTEDIPTDIVLVLDQSGSMDDPIGTVSFEPYEDESAYGYVYKYHTRNQDYYEVRANGDNPNLYYPLGDSSYASVSVTVSNPDIESSPISGWNNYYYYNNQDSVYALVDGKYQKVTVTRSNRYNTYTYTLPDGTKIAESQSWDGTPNFGEYAPLYQLEVDDTKNVYTYTYTDAEGVLQTIGTSTGATTRPAFGENNTAFYQKVINNNAGGSRLNALKNAVTTFANNVVQKAAGPDGDINTTEDNVNHRIAVVGYASRADSNNPWINTEVFIGANQYNYNVNAKDYYGSAFQNMNTTQGQANVTASIGALDGNGATYTNYGLEMANGILNANPVQNGEKRNRVIILFTDGYPGKNADDFNQTAADAALTQAKTAKDNGVSVYAVGIFSGADATTPGDKNGTNTQAANWFMQQVCSNNGTPQDPSYYLSAADADTLNNIFQQISDQIESGGSSTQLSSDTVIKDIIAPAFTLPEGASTSDIKLETYACTGKNGDNEYTWSKNSDTLGANATVNGDQVSVTGFDFAENYVGTVTENGNVTYRGDKLVISFKVTPKEGFLGGNNVYTNAGAGVYENSDATEPVLTFDRPQVNVPIDPVTVTATDKNVYLLGSVTAEQLKEGTTVKVGDVELDLSKANDAEKPFGLDPWQTEYVKITVEIKEVSEVKSEDGTTTTTLTDWDDSKELKADVTYQVSVSVAPKEGKDGSGASGAPATAKSGSNQAKVNVFKPELTFKDSEVYYGAAAPTDFSGNKVGDVVWTHDNTLSTATGVTMLGTAPGLTLSGTPDSTKIADGKINTKQDVPVDVNVKIGETDVTDKTTFQHTNCDGKTCTVPDGKEFLLHVKTCQLTVTKTGGTENEPYVFTVYKDSEEYTEVTVVGNGSETIYELPVGTYTIAEDTGWSWRFTYNDGGEVMLSAENTTGTITCTNTQKKHYWLNGFSAVVKNTFGVTN